MADWISELLAHVQLHFDSPALVEQALTHRSFVNEHESLGLLDNERLEFLGDAIIDFMAGEMLYRRFPGMLEGDLTRLRSSIVRTESLAEMGAEIGFSQLMRIGKGEEANGGRLRARNLCGMFEAFVGALYLDQGIQPVQGFVLPRLEARLDQVMAGSLDRDARSTLQEISQSRFNLTPMYRQIEASGPDHDRHFVYEAVIGGQVVARGEGRSKQAAAQAAANTALDLVTSGRFTLGGAELVKG